MNILPDNKNGEKVKIDIKDKKILSLLADNSRLALTQIAKKVGLSRDGVSYRINGYESHSLIRGYRTMINLSKFGYSNYHLFIKLNNPLKENEKKIVSRLIKIPNIRAILKFSGNYDLEVALIARDLIDLDGLITQITNICTGFIQEYEILAIVKNFTSRVFPKSFLEEKNSEVKHKDNESVSDKKDIQILKILGESANKSLSEIGTSLSLSADAVTYRIKNMLASNVIIKFLPVINYSAIDYNMHAVMLNLNPLNEANEKKLQEFLEVNKNTLWAVKCIGRFNILIYFLTKNTSEIQDTLIELRSLFPKQINLYESLTAYEEYKYVYFPKELF